MKRSIREPRIAKFRVEEMTVKTTSVELQRIPGVGPRIAQELLDLGIRRVADLNDADPEELYERLCLLRGTHIDRCVLYVFRCAVYYASHERHEPDKLKWWNWKDAVTSGT